MTDPWTPVFSEDEEPSIEGAVYQALGAASMCWDPRPSTAVFVAEEATAVAEGLLAFLRERGHDVSP